MYRTKRRQKNIKQKTRWFGHCAENIIKILYKVDNRTHSGSRFSVRGTIYVWSAALRNWSRLLLLFFCFLFIRSFPSASMILLCEWCLAENVQCTWLLAEDQFSNQKYYVVAYGFPHFNFKGQTHHSVSVINAFEGLSDTKVYTHIIISLTA